MEPKIKILVPTDFSEVAENAVQFAVGLSKKFESELILMNVCQYPLRATDVPFETIEREMDLMRNRAKDGIVNLMNIVRRENPSTSISSELDEGDPVEKILETAENINADLIIIGAHGISGIKNFVFGSVAIEILEKSKVPVLVIPHKVHFKSIDNIVYASNYLDKDIETIKEMSVIAQAFHSHVSVIHVNGKEDARTPWKKQFEEDVRINTAIEDLEFETISDKSIVHGIEHYTNSHDTDLLVMLTRKRGFFDKLFYPSVTEKFTFHTNLPILVFHDLEEEGKII